MLPDCVQLIVIVPIEGVPHIFFRLPLKIKLNDLKVIEGRELNVPSLAPQVGSDQQDQCLFLHQIHIGLETPSGGFPSHAQKGIPRTSCPAGKAPQPAHLVDQGE